MQAGSPSRSSQFLTVFFQPQSYLNIGYLLLALPLGIAYFAFLVAGLALGIGLVIVWVGIPVLVLVLATVYALGRLERGLTVALLRYDIPLQRREKVREVAADAPGLSVAEVRIVGAWRRAKRHLSDPLTWSGMLYLLMKLPFGIVSFVVAATLLVVTLVLITAPVLYVAWPDGVPSLSMDVSSVEEALRLGAGDLSLVEDLLAFNGFGADALWESVVFAVAGLPMVLVTLHVLNGAAFLWSRWARMMLGSTGTGEGASDSKRGVAQQESGAQSQEPEQTADETGNEERAAA